MLPHERETARRWPESRGVSVSLMIPPGYHIDHVASAESAEIQFRTALPSESIVGITFNPQELPLSVYCVNGGPSPVVIEVTADDLEQIEEV